MNQNIDTEDFTKKVILPYERQANYYETDQMGVIHHSNYIRWFEEARVDYLEKIGLGYDKMEAMGILSPVLGITCEYKSSVKFYDKVIIVPMITYFNGLKMTISYTIIDVLTNQIRTTGESKHCFVNKDFKPINMKKHYKDVYDILAHWTN
ncbi:MAG: acyl-CoA thioester hydrolase [Anaerocolumna sp.]|nr:acyl-CoA thioester hydrolase [Anaerocolumna sp.]